MHTAHYRKPNNSLLPDRHKGRAVVRTGATGAIAPVDFGKEAHIAPVSQDSIVIIAPVD